MRPIWWATRDERGMSSRRRRSLKLDAEVELRNANFGTLDKCSAAKESTMPLIDRVALPPESERWLAGSTLEMRGFGAWGLGIELGLSIVMALEEC
jgi:hypothetical protein